MGTRRVISLAWLVALAACSPGRIGADGGGTSSESGPAPDSESEDGPIVETESDSGDEGDGDPWGGGGCAREGSLKWLDVCPRPDPCDSADCEDGEECLGGLCVAPKPTQACEGVELALHDVVELIAEDNAPFAFADIDGLPGDELITADDGVLQVVRAGELLAAGNLPNAHLTTIHPLQLGGDEHVDLLAYSGHYEQSRPLRSSADAAAERHLIAVSGRLRQRRRS
jgi:hypothetical protein